MNGRRLSLKSPSDAIEAGIAYLSENRKEEGLAVKCSSQRTSQWQNVQEISQRFGVLSRSREMEVAQRYVKDLVIKRPAFPRFVSNLSGGNSRRRLLPSGCSAIEDSDLRRANSRNRRRRQVCDL